MEKPHNCRMQQQARGEPYPRSGCEVCHNGGLFGCIFEKDIPTDAYYVGGNFYHMLTHQGMGEDYYRRWRERWSEFPTHGIKFVHHEVLDYSKPDIVGYIPDVTMIAKRYFHAKTQRIYTVDGFIWDSDLDRWKVYYTREGCGISFGRLPDVFVPPRFVEVK